MRINPGSLARLRTLLLLLAVLSCHSSVFAQKARPTLVGEEDEIGYTLEDEWGRWWRRISDRGGRDEPAGPLQQRFPVRQYPTHQSDMATAEYPLGDEYAWAKSRDGARWWVHSYNAVQLGTNVQLKMGRPVGEQWHYHIRYDRLYTRDTWSDLVQADFTWRPKPTNTPYASISVFPRIEKQDTDIALTVGYESKRIGDARLRIWGLDAFSTAAYAVAVSRGSPLDYLWKQKSVPLAISAELASARIGGFRTELYLGGIIPQRRELYTEELEHVRRFEEWAALFGAMLEYKLSELPIWLGVTSTIVTSHFEKQDLNEPAEDFVADEDNVQARMYFLSVPRQDMRVEVYWRLTSRPEEITTVADPLSYRKDKGSMLSARWQWLLSKTLGYELSYWRYDRRTEGPPDVAVDGTGHRIATRMLWHMDRLTATFGVGWDPEKAGFYDGSGGTLAVRF